jgi:hypothetical protein
MDELKIKAQSLPGRCEVCHQADFFDAEKNYCARCANLNIVVPPVTAHKLAPTIDRMRDGLFLGFLLHFIQLPMMIIAGAFFGFAPITLLFIGVSQLVYMIPAMVINYRRGQLNVMKGLIIISAITFMLNAACFGLLFLLFRVGG